MEEQLGHGSAQIAVETYGHLIPGANRAGVDRLDDKVPAQPGLLDDAATIAEMQRVFEKMVNQIFTSSNQMMSWLRQIEALRNAAS